MSKKESQPVKESAEQIETQTGSLATIFSRLDAKKKLERRNMPQMVRPADVPISVGDNQTVLQGKLIRVVDSPVSSVKGKLLWLQLPNGMEITFPCTGTIRNALAPGLSDDKLEAALNKEVGKTIYLIRRPDKQSAKYKKSMFMFDVFNE